MGGRGSMNKGRLTEKYGIEVVVPDSVQQQRVHEIIYSELCLGKIDDDSREYYVDVIASLHAQGCIRLFSAYFLSRSRSAPSKAGC